MGCARAKDRQEFVPVRFLGNSRPFPEAFDEGLGEFLVVSEVSQRSSESTEVSAPHPVQCMAWHATSASRIRHLVVASNAVSLAERVGFDPSSPCGRRFSRPTHFARPPQTTPRVLRNRGTLVAQPLLQAEA